MPFFLKIPGKPEKYAKKQVYPGLALTYAKEGY